MMVVGLKSLSQTASYAAHRAVFEVQRAQRFYHPSAYTLACTLSSLPLVLLDTASFGELHQIMAASRRRWPEAAGCAADVLLTA